MIKVLSFNAKFLSLTVTSILIFNESNMPCEKCKKKILGWILPFVSSANTLPIELS